MTNLGIRRKCLYGVGVLGIVFCLAYSLFQPRFEPQSALAAVTVPTVNMFVLIDGIPGESTDRGHLDWIDALSYATSVMNECIAGGGGGGGAGTASFTFKITKPIDKATPRLVFESAIGRHIDHVTIELVNVLTNTKLMDINLSEVFVKSIEETASGNAPRPTETVEFCFRQIEWEYYPPSGGGSVKACWDTAKYGPC